MVVVDIKTVGQDKQVALHNGKTVRYVNLDNAASTPALQQVFQEVQDFLPYYSSVHRGSGFKSRVSTKMYEEARSTVLNFFGGNEDDHVVIFGVNTSEAINKLAYRLELQQEDIVLVSMLEHHSNDLPWRSKACMMRVESSNDGTINTDHLRELVQKYGNKIKLIAVTGASNVTGHISDIHAIAALAHSVDAEILVDGAQLAPHRPIDIKSLADDEHIDYLAVSAHKMYAPFGSGALIARKDTLSRGAPEYSGGGTIDFVSLDDVVWASTPDRDEVGSPNVVGAIAFAASLRELQKIGMDAIVSHEQKLVAYAVKELKKIPKVTVYGATNEQDLPQRTGVVSFAVQDVNHALVAEVLAAEYGVGVRNGCFCAHPYVIDLLGINPEQLSQIKISKTSDEHDPIPGLVRMSFGLYNSIDDIDRALQGIQAIVKGSHNQDYKFNPATGCYDLKDWPLL
jgi:cysteine desulfurase/selenocysteine lyase